MIAIRFAFLAAIVLSAMGCRTTGPQVRISPERARELNLELSGGIAADNSGSIYVTTPTAVMLYKPNPNQIENLLIDPCPDIRDVAVTPEGVVLVLRRRELSACVAGYLVSLHSLPEDAIAVSCDREFAYVLTARGRGARLIRIALAGGLKGQMQTLLTTEDRPRALCAVRGGCLVASGGNIVKVSEPAPTADKTENQVATVLLAAVQEPVTSVVADQDRLIVYFATEDTTYAWIQGQIVPLFPAGSRLAWAKDTLTICRVSRPDSQMIQIPAVSKHAADLLRRLEKGVPGNQP
jgi:hypothetical protein